MSSLKEKRLGEVNVSKQGYKMKVIEYKDANNIVVEFECGFKTPTSYRSFESGSLKYPKAKQQFNVQTYVKPKNRQGLTNYNTQGYKMTILEYNTSENITVVFEDGATVSTVYSQFILGQIRHPSMARIQFADAKAQRTGEVGYNTHNREMCIIEYRSSDDITVEFDNGVQKDATYARFKTGQIWNPYDRRIAGVGYLGEGPYSSLVENGKDMTIAYAAWYGMITRCYDPKLKEKAPTYKECTVVEEWHNFQNFATWCDENYYDVEGQTMMIDKDLLVKGNKVYGPETCVFLPHSINQLFKTSRVAVRNGIPKGIRKIGNSYSASYRTKRLGTSPTMEGAFLKYKKAKKLHIQEITDNFRPYLPFKVINALETYRVELEDK